MNGSMFMQVNLKFTLFVAWLGGCEFGEKGAKRYNSVSSGLVLERVGLAASHATSSLHMLQGRRPRATFVTAWTQDIGGLLAAAKTHRRKRGTSGFVMTFVVLVAVLAFISCVAVTQAQGSGEVDSSTIGVGKNQSSSTQLSASERFSQTSDTATSDVSDVTRGAQRSITVHDPEPVVVPLAVDETNSEAVEMAKKYCTLDPLPTAKHIAPDTADGTWSTGVASAYSIADNDDGKGNFGVTATASGIELSHESITVAVPESESWRLGQICEICYDGKVVIATVTDTGGFAKYGRALDLAPGVYKAFGCSTVSDWGTRTVSYRFLS